MAYTEEDAKFLPSLLNEEGLTQPNHISIVYYSEQEAENYRRHFIYLADRGLMQDKWEELELAPMAGIEGLKAFRILPLCLISFENKKMPLLSRTFPVFTHSFHF